MLARTFRHRIGACEAGIIKGHHHSGSWSGRAPISRPSPGVFAQVLLRRGASTYLTGTAPSIHMACPRAARSCRPSSPAADAEARVPAEGPALSGSTHRPEQRQP
jgi:hypothetical protein